MKSSPLYNGQNLDFTGNAYNNPYGLIQKIGGKKIKTRSKKTYKKRKIIKRNKHPYSIKRKPKLCLYCHLFH
jgi:hypothetical protein